MKLNFVNRAYVDAVGAEDGIEVVDEAPSSCWSPKAALWRQPQLRAKSVERQPSRANESFRRRSTGNGGSCGSSIFRLGDAGVAGLAIDIQDLSDARNEFRLLSEAQRTCSNMMSSGVAQFDTDHALSFANLPFQRLFAFRDQWLAEKPEFVRVLDRMRENGKLPEVRDFPAWRAEHESWFRSAEPVGRKLAASRRHAFACFGAAHTGWRPAADIRGSEPSKRSLPARATYCCGCGRRRLIICSRPSPCSPPTAG